jgi:threonine/homoserine/homoserine lactone efflux protein
VLGASDLWPCVLGTVAIILLPGPNPLFVLSAAALSALHLATMIFTGSRLAAQFRRRRRLAATGTTAVTVLFIGVGVKLATASA